jgi:hypothetical protein
MEIAFPRGLKPSVAWRVMYGLKPVPFNAVDVALAGDVRAEPPAEKDQCSSRFSKTYLRG